MPSIASILSPFFAEEPVYTELNRVLGRTKDLRSLIETGPKLKRLCDTPKKQAYYICLMFQLAASDELQAHAEAIFTRLYHISSKSQSGLLDQEHPHLGLQLPKGSLYRAVFSLMAAMYFAKRPVTAIREMVLINQAQVENPLMTYVMSELREEADLWFSLVRYETVPLPYHIRFHHYFKDITTVPEAREAVFSLIENPPRRFVVNQITRCHAIFIIPEKTESMYVAHVNPSQAENLHCFFGTPVEVFQGLSSFIATLDKLERCQVVVFDNYGLSNMSLKRLKVTLDKCQKDAECFEVISPAKETIARLTVTEQAPYHIVYDNCNQSFILVQGQMERELTSLAEIRTEDDDIDIDECLLRANNGL